MRVAKILFALALVTPMSHASSKVGADYSGFWRTDCDNAFGLQIIRAPGNLYSVSFCGPGGCFRPGTYLPNTPIDGDSMYEVVNEAEIRLKVKDGTAMAYRKCTNDTHPVLQYPGAGV